MIDILKKTISNIVEKQGIISPLIKLEHPEDNTFGDFSSNIAMIYAKELKMNSKTLAELISKELKELSIKDIDTIEIAGPGFINFKLKSEYFFNEIKKLNKEGVNIGKIDLDKGKKIMVEYTDPNPFKIFHIGHLMANTIGESLSRIIEFSGADVIRACYQGDIGLHVAKTIWAVLKDGSSDINVKYLGDMYVIGNNKYETDNEAKEEIIEINKKIFEKSDENINKIYDLGRRLSLEYFDKIYKELGTKFDEFYFESEIADDGIKIVNEFTKKNVFESSEGAIVFHGEKFGEHTRVFINSQGLPTYEAKELGLTKRKFDKYPDLSESIAITANEQDAYFNVVLAAIRIMYPDIASRMKHISHGLLRPSSGKMSSRKGNIISAEILLEEFEKLVEEKLKDREFDTNEYNEAKKTIAVSALKYTILRQSIGGDIIYDPSKAVSFEGDSGPYLQYSFVRANAILLKAKEAGISSTAENIPEKADLLEKIIIRFPEIIERARLEYSPNYIVTYLTDLASAFNSYYTNNQIVDKKDNLSSYRVMLTRLFANVMKNGLWILGIDVPRRM